MRLIARCPTKTDLESTFLELKINCLRETHEDVQLEITGGWVKVPKKNFCKGNFLRAVMRKKNIPPEKATCIAFRVVKSMG